MRYNYEPWITRGKVNLDYLNELYKNDFDDFLNETFSFFMLLINMGDYNILETTFMPIIQSIFLKESDNNKSKRIIEKYSELLSSINIYNNWGKIITPLLKIKKSIHFNQSKLIEKYNILFKNDKVKLFSYLVFNVKNISLIIKYLENNIDVLRMLINNNENMLNYLLKYYCSLKEDDLVNISFIKTILTFSFNCCDDFFSIIDQSFLTICDDDKAHVKEMKRSFLCKNKITGLCQNYHVSFVFSKEQEKDAQDINLKRRKQFGPAEIITVDHDNDVCLDDAIYLRRNKNGTWSLFIYIVDVPSLIPRNSLLDLEARKREEALYLRDIAPITLYPMNFIMDKASLLPNVSRNVFTYEIIFDDNLDFIGNNITDYFKISRNIIKNSYQMSYHDIDSILNHPNTNAPFDLMIIMLDKIAAKLKVNNPRINQYHKASNVLRSSFSDSMITDYSKSAIIIEQLMTLINKLVPEYMSFLGLPFLFRVNNIVDNIDINVMMNDVFDFTLCSNLNLNHLDLPELANCYRAIANGAKYSSINTGHDGLGSSYYARVSAPLRRYPDAFEEYVMTDFLFKRYTAETIKIYEQLIPIMAEYFNQREEKNNQFSIQYNVLSKRKKW